MGMLDEPLDLVSAVIRRLQLGPDEVLPTMAGALTAAALHLVAHALAPRPQPDDSDDASLPRRLPGYAPLGAVGRLRAGKEGATANPMDAVFAKLKAEDMKQE
jgi:hypothetical protein